MKTISGIGILALLALSANGCSSSSSAQSGPVLRPVVASGSTVAFVTPNQNGAAFFWFRDTTTGNEPWYVDDSGNAFPLGDLFPGPGFSTCPYQGEAAHAQVAVVGDDFYFWANDGVNGCEVWRTDGTPEGTALFADIIPGAGGFMAGGDLVAGGNNLFVSGRVTPELQELYLITLN